EHAEGTGDDHGHVHAVHERLPAALHHGCPQPGRTGDNAVQAVVFGPDGSLAAVPELRLSFTLPDKDVGPIEADLVDRGGYWSANTVTLPLPGTWTMRATVRVSEIDQVSETRRIRVER
ncbi:hypothetical protein ACN6LI_007367, partial [Streptomyces violaceoruber]